MAQNEQPSLDTGSESGHEPRPEPSSQSDSGQSLPSSSEAETPERQPGQNSDSQEGSVNRSQPSESSTSTTGIGEACPLPHVEISPLASSIRCRTPELRDSGIALINPECVTRPSPSVPIPPQTFPSFPLLPAEIRLRVYELALPAQGTTVSRIYNTEELRFGLRRRVPPILQACRESRYSFVKINSTDMRRVPFEFVYLPSTGKGVYMDWEKDSLFIRRGFNISATELGAFSRLKSLVMDWGLRPCWVRSSLADGVAFIRKFPALKVLTLLVEFNENEWTVDHGSARLLRIKRKETRAIAQQVRNEFDIQALLRPWWERPELRVVHKTEYWRMQPEPCRY